MIEPLECRRLLHNATLVNGVLTLEGVDGENDDLRVSLIGDVYRAQAVNDGFTQDFDASLVGSIVVTGGSGNDAITLVDVPIKSQLFGDEGDDTINGGAGRDLINGGDGNDVILGNGNRDLIFGGAGDDSLSGGNKNDTLIGDAGADFMSGGAGTFDRVSYADRSLGASVTIDDLANDGEAGENDNVAATVEAFFGGSGDDFFRGSGKPNILSGGLGDDTLIGGGGNDIIFGDGGADDIQGQGGNDLLHSFTDAGDAESDIDTLSGGSGTDTAVAGAGDDVSTVP